MATGIATHLASDEMAPKARGSSQSTPHPTCAARDVERHWVEGALALCLADEASFAVVGFLGVSPGLLQKLTGLLMLCGEGENEKEGQLSEGYFLIY